MKKIAIAISACGGLIAMSGCHGDETNRGLIYRCDEYSVYEDSVVQGEFKAVAVSPTEITTNYRSPELSGASSKVQFRFSLNSRDNELLPGRSHNTIIGLAGEKDRVWLFGDTVGEISPQAKGETLPNDTEWTLRLDMRPVLRSFKQLGYYVTPTSDTIYADDFKGVWVAGSVEPLSWDFENLYGKDDRKLVDRGDSIFEVTLTVNPTTERPQDPTGWRVDSINPHYPTFTAKQMLPMAVYNMGIADIVSNIRPDECFRAGKEWDGVWTRDVSYAIYLSLAYLDPQRSMSSLRAKVKNGHIIQDTGTGGAWPVSSDRIVWSLAAWEIYLTTGDRAWLAEAAQIIANTLEADMKVVYDPYYKMMHGEQSYLDWREQTYPRWMQPKDIYESMCLGTNVVFCQACKILGMMSQEMQSQGSGEQLSPEVDKIVAKGEELRQSINTRLWMPQRGYYSEYLYGGAYAIQSQSNDNLGQALSVIFDVATPDMSKSLVEKTPVVPFGTPSVYPQLPDIKPYHNDAVWPFVQAYWNLACAKTGNMTALDAGIAAIYRAAALFSTNKELYVASNGDYRGTAVNSDSQLWSCAGNVAMVFRVFAGMSFTTKGIELNPVVPTWLTGDKVIDGFKYRDAVLSVTIKGTGTKIAAMTIDNKPVELSSSSDAYIIPADLQGDHKIVVTMADNKVDRSSMNLCSQRWMPSTPLVDWTTGNQATITNYQDGMSYQVFLNSVAEGDISEGKYTLADAKIFTMVDLVPIEGDIEGFTCRPYEYIPEGSLIMVQAEDFARGGTKYVVDPAKASRFVELTLKPLRFTVNVPQEGDYFIDARYANGNGPINTENKCCIRSLMVNDSYAGSLVMPQRGLGEWLSTGYSNMLRAHLQGGDNTLEIIYNPWDENMNADVNTALIDFIRIIKK
ncbi:MAG: hypothetical protein LIP02_03205 [Bacteroidales bacterium]|nr:hypothetical protein [Bacteroidales bacterium]